MPLLSGGRSSACCPSPSLSPISLAERSLGQPRLVQDTTSIHQPRFAAAVTPKQQHLRLTGLKFRAGGPHPRCFASLHGNRRMLQPRPPWRCWGEQAGDRWRRRGKGPRSSGVEEISGIPECRSQDADLEPWEGGKAEARGSAEPGIAEQL